ncbi:PQQ-dependent sugar dehydrogenase [Citromicrobium bathyomarinum]|uniref:PQQ-dependent sugar dehydrogenase n=1 Tax=Citromicrobium bathyomarinum TaxID=72174 RepID=UPI00315B1CAE
MISRKTGASAVRPSCLALAATFLLMACGGEGSSATPTPTPVGSNSAPTFTSATTASIAENSTGAFYTAVASDADGDAITLAIEGGADADLFAISGSQLRFSAPPNFDLPADSDRDNAYQVTLRARDGRGGSADLALTVTVSNDREGIAVRRVATGLTDAVALAAGEGATGLLVGFQNGEYLRIDGATGAAGARAKFGSIGVVSYELLDILERPGSGAYNGVFFLLRLEGSNALVVFRNSNLVLGSPANPEPVTGSLGFGPNGDIFVAFGASNGADAQNEASFFGKLFRVTNNPDPYAGASCCRYFFAERVGRGVRSPHGLGLVNGMVAFTDRGADVADEVSAYPGSGYVNFGWPFFEGTQRISDGEPASLTAPLAALPLGSDTRASAGLLGPVFYDGTAIDGLRDHVVFLDADGTVFSYDIDRNADGTVIGELQVEVRTEDFAPDAGSIESPVAVVRDNEGTVYILDGDGELFRVEAAT